MFVWKLKKACLFYLSDTYVWIYVFRSSHEKLLYQTLFDIETDVPQNFVKRSFLVKLLYAYSFTKDKLPLKYFIRKII